ncbi:hypothetical protein Tco_1397884 [Tanacetum coccineum]
MNILPDDGGGIDDGGGMNPEGLRNCMTLRCSTKKSRSFYTTTTPDHDLIYRVGSTSSHELYLLDFYPNTSSRCHVYYE